MLGISSAIGQLATASRMLWAFAREDGVPFSRWVAKVGVTIEANLVRTARYDG